MSKARDIADSASIINYLDGLTTGLADSPTFTGTVTASALAVDTDVLLVDDTNNRVGVNNSSPSYPLDVTGNARIKSSLILGSNPSDPGSLILNDTSTTAYTLTLKGTGTRVYTFEGSSSGSAYSLIFNNANVPGGMNVFFYGNAVFNENGDDYDFRVESDTNTHAFFLEGSSGNVGIGTSSPAYPFVISDGGNIGFEFSPDDQNTGVNRIYSYDRGTSAYKDFKLSASQIIFGYGSSGGNEAMRIDTSGNLLINTTSGNASSRLVVSDADVQVQLKATSNSGFINFDGTNLQLSTNRDLKTGSFSDSAKSNAALFLRGTAGGSIITFYTSPSNNTTATERMRIDSSGNVGIGTTTPSYTLDTYGAVASRGSGVGNAAFILQEVGNNPWYITQFTGGSFGILYNGTSSANTKLAIDASGNVGIGTTTPSTNISATSTVLEIANSNVASVKLSNTGAGAKWELTSVNDGSFRIYDDDVLKTSIDLSGTLIHKAAAIFNEDGGDSDFRVESDTNTHALFLDGATGNIGLGRTPSAWGSGWLGVQLSAASQYGGTLSYKAGNVYLGYNAFNNGTNWIYGSNDVASLYSLGGNGSHNWSFAAAGTGGNTISFTTAMTLANTGILTNQIGAVFNESGADSDFRVESDTSTHALFVDASTSRVGIGESSPDGLLHLTGDTNANGAELYLQVNNNNTTDNLGAIHFGNFGDSTLSKILSGTSGANNSSYLTFSTSSSGSQSEAMRIDSSGNVTVANINPAPTNNVRNPGKLKLEGRGWNTSLGDRAQGWAFENSGIYSSPVNGQVYPTLLFQAKTTDSVFNETGVAGFRYSSPYYEFFTNGGAVFNETSLDQDFRVESNNNANMLFVNAGNDRVGIGTNDPALSLDVAGDVRTNNVYRNNTTSASSAGLVVSNGNSTQFASAAFWDSQHASYAGGIHLVGRSAYSGTVSHAGVIDYWTFDGSSYTREARIGWNEYTFNEASRDADFRVESDTDSHALFVDASTNNVGIRYSVPTSTLFIAGNKTFVWNASGIQNVATVSVGAASTTNNLNSFAVSGTTHNTYYPASFVINSQYGEFGTNSTNFDLTSFGVNYPGWNGSMRLRVSQGTSIHEALRITPTDTVFNELSNNTDFRVESDTNTHALFVDAGNSRVGINSTSPLTTFDVRDSTLPIFYIRPNNVIGKSDTISIIQAAATTSGSFTSTGFAKIQFESESSGGGNRAGSGISFYTNLDGFAGTTDREVSRFDRQGTLIHQKAATFNEEGGDNDFRVESDTNSYMFHVDASLDAIGIGSVLGSSYQATQQGMMQFKNGGSEANPSDGGIEFYAGQLNSGYSHRLCAFDNSAGDTPLLLQRRNNSATWSTQVTFEGSNNNVVFAGTVSKGGGSFKIDHPLPAMQGTHHLVHSFIEGPQADNLYRGRVTLVDGQASVNIDTASNMTEGTFVLLNRDVQCFTSNETGWTAVKGKVSGNMLSIEAQDNTSTDTVSWMVIGERQDQFMYDNEFADEDGHIIVEPLKKPHQQNT